MAADQEHHNLFAALEGLASKAAGWLRREVDKLSDHHRGALSVLCGDMYKALKEGREAIMDYAHTPFGSIHLIVSPNADLPHETKGTRVDLRVTPRSSDPESLHAPLVVAVAVHAYISHVFPGPTAPHIIVALDGLAAKHAALVAELPRECGWAMMPNKRALVTGLATEGWPEGEEPGATNADVFDAVKKAYSTH